MLDTNQIEEYANKIMDNFDGVSPLDMLPIKVQKTYNLIVNTEPSNLPGQHWIAIVVRPGKVAYVFDPMGFPPPLKVQTWLSIRKLRWTSNNNRQVQSNTSTMCGFYCLYFLFFTSIMPDISFENIMDHIFPRGLMYSDYEKYVRSFVRDAFPYVVLK